VEDTIQDLIASGELDVVSFDSERPMAELKAAIIHYETALSSIDTDPEGAFILLYESAKRALQAILARESLRVRKPPNGNHFTFVKAGRTNLVTPEIWKPLDWMRSTRNQTSYLDQNTLPASEADARQALIHVVAMLEEARSRVSITRD
jgi:hypothetical protein